MKRSGSVSAKHSSAKRHEGDGGDDEELGSQPDQGNVEWIGACFETKKSATSFEKVRIDGVVYAVGDSVYINVEHNPKPQPMLLTHLWQDDEGGNWAYGNWYYHRNEIKVKEEPCKLFDDELFGSNWGDELDVETFCGKFALTDDPTRVRKGRTRLCRFAFDPSRKALAPISSRPPDLSIRDDEEEATEEIPMDPKHQFSIAISALQLSAVPKIMPCRDAEKKTIYEFILNGIRNGGSTTSLYISGMPGTGKTASVHEAIQQLRVLQRKGALQKFDFVEVNGLKVSFPDEAYSIIAEHVLPNNPVLNASKAAKALGAHYDHLDSNRRITVLLIDEIDQLVTKKQQLLYDIFDWPQRPHAKLVVLSVSNTINFPDTLLPRIQSRMGKERVTFHPYSRDQIQTIIAQRLSATNVFSSDAIEFAARKVSLLSGDVRRALQLCRRAIAVCVRQGGGEVNMNHVNHAVREIDARAHCQAIAALSLPQKAFLICLHKHCVAVQQDAVLFQDVIRRFFNLCQTHSDLQRIVTLGGPGATSKRAWLVFVHKLKDYGLVETDNEGARVSEGPLLGLTFDYEDMRVALQTDAQATELL